MTDVRIPRSTSPPPGAEAVALSDGLEADPPASCLTGSTAADLVVVVAPSAGRFRPAGADPAGPDRAGAVVTGGLIGHVTGGRGRQDPVWAPVDAERADLLVRPGQQVALGQGLAWLRRTSPEPGAAR